MECQLGQTEKYDCKKDVLPSEDTCPLYDFHKKEIMFL